MSDRIRIAAYLIAVGDLGILLARIAPGYPHAGSWTLPGGGVEWGEHPDDALRREVYEEAGLRLADARLLAVDSRVLAAEGRHAGLHAIRLLYTAEVDGEPHVTEHDGSVDAAQWIELEDLDRTPTVELVDVALDLIAPI
jgi:ADP-ribose pyrophosphatase YjhB (NUDIX family)